LRERQSLFHGWLASAPCSAGCHERFWRGIDEDDDNMCSADMLWNQVHLDGSPTHSAAIKRVWRHKVMGDRYSVAGEGSKVSQWSPFDSGG
jgi:hypothetical protein